MSAAIISLIAVTVGFVSLVVYVYRPSQRQRWREYGAIPLDDEDASAPRRETGHETEHETERPAR